MADTFSANLRLRLLEQGANDGTWGPLLNAGCWDMVDEAIAGSVTINVAAGNVTMTTNNGVTDQARPATVIVVGTSTPRVITAPVTSKMWLVYNNTSGTHTFRAGVGDPGVSLQPGRSTICFCDPNGPTMRQASPLVPPSDAAAATANTTVNILDVTAGATSTTLRWTRQGNKVIATLVAHAVATVSTNGWRYDLAASAFPAVNYPDAECNYAAVVLQAGAEVSARMVVDSSGTLAFVRADNAAWTVATTRQLSFNITMMWQRG